MSQNMRAPMKLAAAALAAAALATTAAAAASGELDAVLGRALFERNWVTGGASTEASDGLGPLFSARGCAGCHAGPTLGARFTGTPDGKLAGRGVVIRFGDPQGRPDPLYGHLLQNAAIAGLKAEGRVVLAEAPRGKGGFDVAVHLQRGPLAPGMRMAPRLAPPLVGRAALADVDAAAVLALADPDDRDGDGISGRARMVSSGGQPVLGRYGWKAATPDLEIQIADAFAHEMGLSSARRPLPFGDCTAGQPDCLAAPTGLAAGGHELAPEMVDLVAAYLRSLPQPPIQSAALGGSAEKFAALGCAACHTPSLPTTDGGAVAAYTDLLLHDMGPALDDGVGEPGVASSEWRTAPLAALANADHRRRFLHDGSAATLDAAIRAHGGEAAPARDRYAALPAAERGALIAFLEAL